MLTAVKRIVARAPIYATYAKERPTWAILIIFGRLHWARWIERKLRARRSFEGPLPESTYLETPSASEIAERLHEDGVCLGFVLKQDTLDQVKRFAEEHPCAPRDDQRLTFLPKDISLANQSRKRDILAAYYFHSVKECAAIMQLASDDRLIAIAQSYLRQSAKNIRIRLWWSFPSKDHEDADLHSVAQDRFHFDLNDWRTIKFFFYISDVGDEDGPHMYIRGSHNFKRLAHQYTLLQGKDKRGLERSYGTGEFKTVLGSAGSGFAEDPFVFHTGSTVRERPRLILELEFGHDDPSPSYRYGVLG